MRLALAMNIIPSGTTDLDSLEMQILHKAKNVMQTELFQYVKQQREYALENTLRREFDI